MVEQWLVAVACSPVTYAQSSSLMAWKSKQSVWGCHWNVAELHTNMATSTATKYRILLKNLVSSCHTGHSVRSEAVNQTSTGNACWEQISASVGLTSWDETDSAGMTSPLLGFGQALKESFESRLTPLLSRTSAKVRQTIPLITWWVFWESGTQDTYQHVIKKTSSTSPGTHIGFIVALITAV